MGLLRIQPIVVTTTSDDRKVLEELAKTLVEKKLAACVQISGPVESHYVWKGKHECANEWSCSIKTSRELFQELKKTIYSIHNYENPQLLAVDVVEASQSYLIWMEENLLDG